MWNIFEHWWTALLLGLVVQLVLAGIHIFKPDTRKLWHILIPIAIVGIGIGIELLVQTDSEKIEALVNTSCAAVRDRNIAAVDSILAPDYSDSVNSSKTDVMNYCKRWFGSPLITGYKINSLEMFINGTEAQVNLIVITHIDPKGLYAEMAGIPIMAKVKLSLEKNVGGKWLIKRAELIEVNNQSVRWNQI